MKNKVIPGLFIFLLLASCTSIRRSDLFTNGKLLSGGVPSQPGAVAWAPDSIRLAVIKDQLLTTINTNTEVSGTISGIRPVFIDWSPGNDLLIVNKVDGGNELAIIDPASGTVRTVSARKALLAAKWLNPPDTFILFDSAVSRLSIGTFVTYKFTKIDNGKEEEFFNLESYLPTLEKNLDAVNAWTYAGLRPLHDTVLTPEFHIPPRMGPFTLFKTADPVITEETGVVRLAGDRFSIPASWSPDGSRLAVTDDKGRLIILDPDKPENMPAVNPDIRGKYPAWNPRGSQIYLGGWLLQPDGSVLGQIVSNAFDSIGVWSPDGTRLAVLAGTDVLYFDGFSPSFTGMDSAVNEGKANAGDKVRVLKKLLKEGLISYDEFKARRAKLFSK